MKSFLFLLSSIFLFSFTTPTETSETYLDLSGTWNMSGSTQYGYLDRDVEISDYGRSISFQELDSYGNSTRRTVKSFYKSGSSVTITITGNDGIGRFTTTYDLKVINNDLLQGSMKTVLPGYGNLPGMSYGGKVTFRKQ